MPDEPTVDAGAAESAPAPASKPATRRAPAKRSAAKKAPAKTAPATKAPAKKAPATKAPAKKAPATKALAKTAPATEAPVTKAPANNAPSEEAVEAVEATPVSAAAGDGRESPTASEPPAAAASVESPDQKPTTVPRKPPGKRATAKRTVRRVGRAAGRSAANVAGAVDSATSAARGDLDPADALRPRRLSGFDFATWRTSVGDPIMRSPMIGLIALDSSPDWDRLVDRFDRASRVAPVLRQRITEGPTDFNTPRLIVDPEFDLSFHMRRYRVAEPGTWDQVLDEARRQSMTDFDLQRPLWSATLLEGLEGGKAALLIKLHHAIADGQGAMMLGATIIDLMPAEQDLGPMPPAPIGPTLDSAGLLGTAMADTSTRLMRAAKGLGDAAMPALTRALRDPVGAVDDLLKVIGSVTKFAYLPSRPLSPVMTGRSINYHFVTFELPLIDLKVAGKSRGQSLNDAFMASLAGGMRLYHERRGEPVESLRVNMPISLRDPDRPAQNAVTIARFELPVGIKDVAERMRAIGALVAAWREEPALHLIDPLAEVTSRMMPTDVLASAAQKSDLTASNVPGVPMPVFIGGAKVRAMFPLMSTVGAASNITLLSYNGKASLGIAMDDAAITDQSAFIEAISDGFAEVLGHEVPVNDPLAG